MRIRSWIAALCVAIAACPAAAETPRKFAVLSLIGDTFLIVNHVAETGNRLGRDRRMVVYLPERALDNAIAADVEHAIRQAAPGASVVKLGGSRALYPREEEIADEPDPVPTLEKVKPAIAGSGITHMVVLSKLRHVTKIALINTTQGEGKLDGLGFYMDHALPTEDRTADQAGRGFLAPFAYFRVSLLDVQSGKVLGFRDIVDSAPVTAGRSPSLQVWESLSSREKVQLMHALVQRAAQDAVRSLVADSAG